MSCGYMFYTFYVTIVSFLLLLTKYIATFAVVF